MLRRLRIDGFKSLHHVDVELRPLTVVFGPNAAGKSNLLEALLLFSRLGTERTLAEAFSESIRGLPAESFTLPERGLPGLFAQELATLKFDADLLPTSRASRGTKHGLRYAVEVSLEPRTGRLRLDDECIDRIKPDTGIPYKTPGPRIQKDAGQFYIYGLKRQGRPRQEDVGGNYTFLSDVRLSGDRYPDFDQLRQELSSWQTYYLDPRVAMRQPQPPQEVSSIGSAGGLIAPFLYRLKNSSAHRRHFDAIRRALQRAIPSVENLDVVLDEVRGVLDIYIAQAGTAYSSRIVSEGTLRVLALCALAADPFGAELIAFEEPENGVHPQRVEVISDILGRLAGHDRRQIIITTHSPLVVADMIRRQRECPDAVQLLLCRRRGRFSSVEPFGPVGELFDDREVRDALISDEDALVGAMLSRGWFDG